MEIKTVRLEISTYRGTSAFAIHYYGLLYAKYGGMLRESHLDHQLTKREATNRNKLYRKNYSPDLANLYSVKPGKLDSAFDTKEDVIEWAKKMWLYYYPDADNLVDEENELLITRQDTKLEDLSEDNLYVINVNNEWRDKHCMKINNFDSEGEESENPETESDELIIPSVLEVPEELIDLEEQDQEEQSELTKSNKPNIHVYPSVEFSVKAYNTDPGKNPKMPNSGIAVFHTFATDVTDDDGNELGFISGGTGYVVVQVKNKGYYLIPHDEIWYAILRAIDGKEQKS